MKPSEADMAKARQLVDDTPSDLLRSDRADLRRDIAQAMADARAEGIQAAIDAYLDGRESFRVEAMMELLDTPPTGETK